MTDKSTKKLRKMISIHPEWEQELETLKKNRFYNVSYAEMYRYLLRLALDAIKNDSNETSPK